LSCMRELAGRDARVQVVSNSANLGLGGSYKRGVALAQGTYVIMIPGDNGFPVESIVEILRHAGRADIVIPIVTNSGDRTRFRAWASRGFTAMLNGMFGLDVGYYNGAVLHRTALLRTIEIRTDGFAYQAEALVKLIARGASYVHCRVPIRERTAGRSSALSLRNQVAVWRSIAHLVADVGVSRVGRAHARSIAPAAKADEP